MYILALVTQKGGSGKSTLSVGLAVAAMQRGERVALIEADAQGTISRWKGRREKPYPRVDCVTDPSEIEPVISRLKAEGVWLAIIDTAATNNALATRAIASADLCLIPARPSPADIEAAIPTLIATRRLDRRFAFILNQAPTRGGPVERSCHVAQLARLACAPLHWAAQRPPGCARGRAGRNRVRAGGKSLGGNCGPVGLDLGAPYRGVE
ncbi:MinD-like ATPase involved in chromosome partitioning or flagellar assembly [Bradyrhizobium diazoefficiens]